MSQPERQKLIPQLGDSRDRAALDAHAAISDVEIPARTCFGARVFMPQQSVWFISLFWLSQSIAILAMSAAILASYVREKGEAHHEQVRREHIACSSVILINCALNAFYVVHGIFKQRREDLVCFLISVCVATAAILFDFFVRGDQLADVHVARCIMGALCLPIDVFTVLYVLQSASWQSVQATERKRLRSAFFACQKLVFHFALLLVCVLEVTETLSLTEQWLTGGLALFTISSVFIGWCGASLHSRFQIGLTVFLTLPFDILIVVLLSLHGHQWLHASPHAYTVSIAFGAFVLVLNVFNATLLIRLYRSPDKQDQLVSRYDTTATTPSFLDFDHLEPAIALARSPRLPRSSRVDIIRSQSVASPASSMPSSFV
jgi:hypothetical protein